MVNIDMFNLVELTSAFNVIPYRYGRLANSGLFTPRSITTSVVFLERQNNVLRLLSTQPKGAPGQPAAHGKRNALTFQVPYIPLEDVILPDEYAGKRAFGTDNTLETEQSVMLRKLAENKLNFEITWEHLHWGALKGLILDGDGRTVIYNLFHEFDIEQKVISFDLDVEATDVRAKCRELLRYVEMNMEGDVSTGVRVFVSPEFFDSLIGHPNVEKFWVNWQGAAEASKVDPRKNFSFGGINWEECLGQATGTTGENVRYIEPGEGHAIPEGTMSTFDFVAAPGNFRETVNTPGEQLYAKAELRKYDQGVDIHMESNVLPLCKRPQLLVKVTEA
jgi:hypothetical protein